MWIARSLVGIGFLVCLASMVRWQLSGQTVFDATVATGELRIAETELTRPIAEEPVGIRVHLKGRYPDIPAPERLSPRIPLTLAATDGTRLSHAVTLARSKNSPKRNRRLDHGSWMRIPAFPAGDVVVALDTPERYEIKAMRVTLKSGQPPLFGAPFFAGLGVSLLGAAGVLVLRD